MANRALLVGINKYKMANSDLSGCVNDVTNIRDGLIKFFGFTIDDIRVITDERTTKKAIGGNEGRWCAEFRDQSRSIIKDGDQCELRERQWIYRA